MELRSTDKWHPYKPRVRDIIISVFLFYLYLHLFTYWNKYQCDCRVNIQMLFLYLAFAGRAICMHFNQGHPSKRHPVLYNSYLAFSAIILAIAILQTYFLVTKWEVFRNSASCSQRSLYIIMEILGYLVALRTVYVAVTMRDYKEVSPK